MKKYLLIGVITLACCTGKKRFVSIEVRHLHSGQPGYEGMGRSVWKFPDTAIFRGDTIFIDQIETTQP